MAHPTNHLRILAPPDPQPSSPESPPLKPRAAAAAAAMATQPTAAKLESSAMAPKSSHLSNYIPFSRLHSQTVVSSQRRPKNSNPPPAIKDSHLQAKALTVSAMVDSSRFHVVKSKPQTKKIVSGCNEKTRKSCKELDRKKLVDEKKETNEGVDDSKALVLVVKDKEMKQLQKGHRLDSLRPAVSLFRKGGRRRSFGGSQVELADIFANNGVKVVSVDMPPVLQIHAVDCARKVHDSMEKFTSKTLALSLKREFDGVYGPAWHCIVGTSFGSFVTHSVGGFLYFSMDQKLYILLFKTTVQRAG